MAKSAASSPKTMASLIKTMQKSYGEEAVVIGNQEHDRVRIPTGIFAFDLATGGGIPKGANTIIYGPESSNKTNLAYAIIAANQRLYPDEVCAFVDIEGTYDPKWAKNFGVQVDKLIRLRPLTAEQAVDMVEQCLYAEDCGLVVLDSLAMMTTTNELESSAEKAVVGGASNPIGKLVRKTSVALNEANMAGRSPTLVYINQTRFKIGVMFGDPETMPGGNALKFQVSLWVRVYGKNIMDSKVNDKMPVRKEVKFVIKKWKVPIYSVNGEFEMAMVPHAGLKIGECDDWSLIEEYLKDLGELEKGDKGGWVLFGETYGTLKEIKERVYTDKEFGSDLRKELIRALMEQNFIEAQ